MMMVVAGTKFENPIKKTLDSFVLFFFFPSFFLFPFLNLVF